MINPKSAEGTYELHIPVRKYKKRLFLKSIITISW